MTSTHTLAVGDNIIVTLDGRDLAMKVTSISPPMSMGRAASAGPRVTASLGPGRYSVTFDDHVTVPWRHAPRFRTHNATLWVCTGCHLAIAGYSNEELGYEHPEPFEDDPSVVDATNGSDPLECEACQAEGRTDTDWGEWPMEWVDEHSDHDHDAFSKQPCPGCGERLAGDRYAVTVEVQTYV